MIHTVLIQREYLVKKTSAVAGKEDVWIVKVGSPVKTRVSAWSSFDELEAKYGEFTITVNGLDVWSTKSTALYHIAERADNIVITVRLPKEDQPFVDLKSVAMHGPSDTAPPPNPPTSEKEKLFIIETPAELGSLKAVKRSGWLW